MSKELLMRLSALMEVAIGVALIAVPSLVAKLLLGAELSDSCFAVARLTGIALLCLGIACWPRGGYSSPQSLWGLFAYNLLAGFYLGYLRGSGLFTSPLLWPTW